MFNISVQSTGGSAYLAWLDEQERPRLRVHGDDIAVERDTFLFGRDQLTAREELLAREHDGDVVLPLREPEPGVLGRVVEDIEPSLAEVRIDRSDADGVVVVPQRTGRLAVPARD